MSFGSRLKERRKKLGISQKQLAEMFNVSKSAVGNWETDLNSPRPALLYQLFEILQCDANFLYQDELSNCDNMISSEELELIKKYRIIDSNDKQIIQLILNKNEK